MTTPFASNPLNTLKISTRLALLIGVLCSLLVAMGGLGLYGINQSNTALQSVYADRTVPAAQLGKIRFLQLANELSIEAALIHPGVETSSQSFAQIQGNMDAIHKEWDAYMATKLTDEEAQLVRTFSGARSAFIDQALQPILGALQANNPQEILRLHNEKIQVLSVPMKNGLDALIALQVREALREFTVATARYEHIQKVSLAAILGGVLFAGCFGYVMVRSIGRQLGAEPGEAAEVVRGVASGDLGMQIVLRPGDTSSLMAQLKRMQTSLAHVVSTVRQSSEGVAAASAEIAQGNHDLSGRTEQQASALEETAASMEELSGTVRHNADNARQANQLAVNASTVAAQGGEAMNQVVATMKDIDDSSKRISDIISVIDGIAFQTNILALNAAVEAARAGEQGRGFAVVASEVRNLAQRSTVAAKEIKMLIDHSVSQVAQGSSLVIQAGHTMTEVVTAIRRVTDIMGEVSAASQEQSQGVAQVGEAVTQMDQVTQQNAALVEESAAAANSLQHQAEQLLQSVAVFKLGAGTDTPSMAAPANAHFPERRGPNRAKNVLRPAFGASKHTRLQPNPSPTKVTATGTDQWSPF
nr:methyl-accepting chemotaxis protein [uncultured Albidiferax sp.]